MTTHMGVSKYEKLGKLVAVASLRGAFCHTPLPISTLLLRNKRTNVAT